MLFRSMFFTSLITPLILLVLYSTFLGIVMTDWWAKANDEGKEATLQNTAAMVRSQNDLYMVVTVWEQTMSIIVFFIMSPNIRA